MPYIGNTPAEKYAAFNVQHFTTSATTSYTLTHAVANELDIRLVINNVIQQPGSGKAYTAAATTLTLSGATTSSDTMYAVYIGKAVQTVTPPADSITEPMISASNSPTNGYVLSAQSGAAGGLTWAADAAGTVTGYTNGVDNRVITSSGATTLNGEADLTFDGTNLDLPDNKRIRLGTGNDVEIYHDSNNTFVAGNSGNQTIVLRPGQAGGSILITNSSSQNIITQQSDSAYLHYAGSTKLRTTTNGLIVSGGIVFDAGGHADVDANRLDDYEEGTFTPSWSVAGGGSLGVAPSTNVGTYTKVGRMCTISINSYILATTGTITSYSCTNLPFTSVAHASGMGQEFGHTGYATIGTIAASSTTVTITKYDATALVGNAYMRLEITYQTT